MIPLRETRIGKFEKTRQRECSETGYLPLTRTRERYESIQTVLKKIDCPNVNFEKIPVLFSQWISRKPETRRHGETNATTTTTKSLAAPFFCKRTSAKAIRVKTLPKIMGSRARFPVSDSLTLKHRCGHLLKGAPKEALQSTFRMHSRRPPNSTYTLNFSP